MIKQLHFLLGALLFLTQFQVLAQSKSISGRVITAEDQAGLPGVTVAIKGAQRGTQTSVDGAYTLEAATTDILVFSFVGMVSQERLVGNSTIINVALSPDAKGLDEVVVTALGITAPKKALAYAISEVKGSDIAQTQRENFINALAGRVAGVEVSATSGMPGASTSVMIRGVSSLSGSNQPLFVVDGLPISNNTFSSANFAGPASTQLENRGVDYGNRAADINPEDIESMTILKGPEASALYGIDAASGAIVITTKRGKAGAPQISYSNSFRLDKIVRYPEIQQVYGRGVLGVSNEGDAITTYFGQEYPEGTQFYDNVRNFFQTSSSQKHNVSVAGGTENNTYRVAASFTDAGSFIPNAGQQKFNFTTALVSKISKYISTDISVGYTKSNVQSVFNVNGGPLLGLLSWPSTEDASDYLDENGDRRFFSAASTTSELENPFFNVNKNSIKTANDRYITSAKLVIDPTSWLKFVGSVGFDTYANTITMVRHPQSKLSGSTGGVFDQSIDNNRNINLQYYAQLTRNFFGDKLTTDLKIGSAVNDQNNYAQSVNGTKFLAPDLYSIENTDPLTHRGRNRLTQRRLVGAFASLNIGYNDFLYLSLTGRNDWSSTLPVANNSFFYPSAGLSFVFTELPALAGLTDVLSYGKFRGSIAQVGKDAAPYSIRPFLESRTTTGGGFGYAFTGPAEALVPEMTTSFEIGSEFKFFRDRIGIDLAYFKKTSVDQIVRNLRLSYGTGYVLKTFNAGEMETGGFEFQGNIAPVITPNFRWDIAANYSHNYSKLVKLPDAIPEYYNSDTYLYNNIRNGARVGGPVNSFSGYTYERSNTGEILISPTTGYPIRNVVDWLVVGDRTPDFMAGITNTFAYKGLSLNFLFEIRKGGDVFNATEHFLTIRGLSMRTLDRLNPRIYDGVLKDGMENSETPTKNNIVINPVWDASFYSATSGELDFIEKDVNWLRLRDVTLRYSFPKFLLQRTKVARSASIFVTGTDLFLVTNYSGLDPVGSATSLATGGSGGYGFDYGNLPMPMGLNIGLNVGF